MGIAFMIFGGIEFLRTISGKRIAKIKTPAELPPAGESLSKIMDEAYAQEMPGELSKPNDFSVSGKPRTVPWNIRRKELEAKSRTKREKLESFRDA
jgi:hypothetical protein